MPESKSAPSQSYPAGMYPPPPGWPSPAVRVPAPSNLGALVSARCSRLSAGSSSLSGRSCRGLLKRHHHVELQWPGRRQRQSAHPSHRRRGRLCRRVPTAPTARGRRTPVTRSTPDLTPDRTGNSSPLSPRSPRLAGLQQGPHRTRLRDELNTGYPPVARESVNDAGTSPVTAATNPRANEG